MAIEKKTIGDLKDHSFFVPSYQRGYRWTEFEVTALLDDVSEFSSAGDKKYCIQPLIVKKREDGSFEVVDGQQRLTTIYIFMKIAAQEIRSAVPPFELNYETRENSGYFLKSLSDDTNSDNSNIDFYHMGRAYKVMNKWLETQPDKSVAIQELNTKIRKSVFFIWYELPQDSDPIAMFTKVNLGKISLTNAELIKALLLNKDNFDTDANKRQTEISIAWDRIEQGLRDDSFWYFLNEKEQSGTRIDMLFDLLANDYNTKAKNPISTNQNYFPFLVFSETLKNARGSEMEIVNALWGDVEKLYAEFRDWYNDLNKYHIIGYLIATGSTITEIFSLTRGKRKSAVATALLSKAKIKYDDLAILALDTKANKKRIRHLLLLFNLATLVCKSEKQYRFPFDIYKREQWDIEHIHATADETDDADDSFGNLALLDCHTNRSYKEAQFLDKRKIIIERESKGLFVPLCTKNVFLKVYSKNLDDMDVWHEKDKAEYVSAVNQTLNTFFNGRSGQ
ncbi:DUF262 domain-containing protein [Paenibacillus sp. FSL R7-0297]|uniref:DUF262 domain-containing protein n=1 Tax=Paenibacillus sp. FSL R7-0297 TaxID=2921680 RepID=UPI0030F52C13